VSVLRIVAAAYRDGWAFVEDGDRRLLVRPPYRRAPVEVSQATVEQAVQTHGFDAEAREIASFRELIAFLEKKRVEIAEAEGTPSLADHERMDRLVRAAPRHILERYLDRVEGELLRRGELDAALRVLSAMSHADVASADDALRERVSRLIAACGEAVAWRRSVAAEAATPEVRADAMRARRLDALGHPPFKVAA
jgi:hypothetical protein